MNAEGFSSRARIKTALDGVIQASSLWSPGIELT